jgi:uncharacterized radical SAM superfamily protein
MVGDLERLIAASRRRSWDLFGKTIKFYAPSFVRYQTAYYTAPVKAFPSISITGSSCALRCQHCKGIVLETMIPATTPADLLRVCRSLKEQGSIGCLISGGCLPNGTVPLGRFVETIRTITKELGLKVIVHTGVIQEPMAHALKAAGVDAALLDVIGSDDTIREVYNLEVGIADYESSLQALQRSGLPFIPHVIVGLHHGKLKGEFAAIDMIANYDPAALVIIALIPLRGTPMGRVDPASPAEIVEVIARARLKLRAPIALGCMRPQGSHRVKTDTLAVEAGINAIAYPDPEAVALARTLGLASAFSPQCCSQIYEDLLAS